MNKKRHNLLAALPIFFVLFASLASVITTKASAEEVLQRKNNVNISYGGYSFTAAGKSVTAIGLLQAQYRRALNPDLSVELAYVNAVSFSGGFSSSFWGFDIGGSYAVGSGFPSNKQVSDVMTIFENKQFGVFTGVGLSMRALPLASGTFTYSGIYVSAQPQYYLNENTEIHGRFQYSSLVNGGSKLQTATVIFGIGMSF